MQSVRYLVAGLFSLFLLSAQAQIVDVQFSDDFQKTLTELYGEREGDYLSQEIIRDVKRSLNRASLDVRRVEITILRAVPNRPTLHQIRRTPSLRSARSFGVGGMELVGQAFDANNDPIGGLTTYQWFERDIRNVVGFSTWTDAHRASNRFSRRLTTDVRDHLMRDAMAGDDTSGG